MYVYIYMRVCARNLAVDVAVVRAEVERKEHVEREGQQGPANVRVVHSGRSTRVFYERGNPEVLATWLHVDCERQQVPANPPHVKETRPRECGTHRTDKAVFWPDGHQVNVLETAKSMYHVTKQQVPALLFHKVNDAV